MPRRSESRKRRPAPTPRPLPIVAGLVAATIAATLLVVSPRADAAFDAPKRLAAATGLAAAAIAWLLRAGTFVPLASGLQKLAAAALATGAGASVVSAAASPHPAVAWDSLRWGTLLSIAVLLGATRELAGGRTWLPGAALVAGGAANACLALAALAGLQLFRLVPTPYTEGLLAGAFQGNEGLLGILLAFASPVAFAFAVRGTSRPVRIAALLSLLLCATALFSIRSFTGLLALLAGLAPFAATERRVRRVAFVAVPSLLLVALAVPALRGRVSSGMSSFRRGDAEAVLSSRAGPWLAAVEMARARPLLGYGPGSFSAEFFAHRLVAEARLGRRFTHPTARAAHAEAHADLLQAAAELGIPAALAFLAAVIAVAGRLARRVAASFEAAALLGVLSAGAVASLFWFPLHRPALAIPLLVTLGRGLVLEVPEEER